MNKTTRSNRCYLFGPFQLSAREKTLWRDGEIVPLTLKAVETLLILVEQHGHVITKDELMERIWPETFVEESGLARNISVLRKVLGEGYIETVPKRGYRFTVSVMEMEEDELPFTCQSAQAPLGSVPIEKQEIDEMPPASTRPTASYLEIASTGEQALSGGAFGRKVLRESSLGRREALVTLVALAGIALLLLSLSLRRENEGVRTLAVLPFRVLDSNGSDDYLGIACAQALIARLYADKRFTIRSIGSVLAYGEKANAVQVGNRLDVDAVVTGQIQRTGDRLRASVQLVRTKDGVVLLARQLDTSSNDIFELQDRIAESVSRALLPPSAPAVKRVETEKAGALLSYSEGRYLLLKRTEINTRQALARFERAIADDPQFAAAYAGLADGYNLLGDHVWARPADSFPRAEEAARHALELDPHSSEARAALAFARWRYDWDWPGAEADFRQAIEDDPYNATAHQWYGLYLATAGRSDEAAAHLDRAMAIEPTSPIIVTTSGWIFYFMKQYDQALAHYGAALDMDPNFLPALWRLWEAYQMTGQEREAIRVYHKILVLTGERRTAATLLRDYESLGYKESMRRMLDGLEVSAATDDHISPFFLARSYALLGEREKAYRWLERGLEIRSGWMVYLKVEPAFDSLHGEERFAAILRRIGFTD